MSICMSDICAGPTVSESSESSSAQDIQSRSNSAQMNGGKKETRWRTKSSSTMEVCMLFHNFNIFLGIFLLH